MSKIGSAPDYTIDAAWLARIKEVVDYAYSEGLYVLINIHGDGYTSIPDTWLLCNSSGQTTIKAKYQKVWQQIANTFVNYNEEFDGTYGTPNTTYYSNINAYNQIFVDTVRQTGGRVITYRRFSLCQKVRFELIHSSAEKLIFSPFSKVLIGKGFPFNIASLLESS